MNFIKKLLFTLSLIAAYLSIKIGAQTAGEYFTTANTLSSDVPGEHFTTANPTSSDVPGCGGTYTSLSGIISSPNYPSDYNNSLTCYYYIDISPANSVNIVFLSFDTESCCDYLQVFCASDSFKAFPRFYGQNAPPFLSINPCSAVQLLFSTDVDTTGQGFRLRYDIGNGLQGGLTMKPVNTYVPNNSNEPIVLSCSSRYNQPDAYPWWSYSADGNLFRIITAQNCSVFSRLRYSNPIYFSTEIQYSARTCNLILSPSYKNATPGFYSCTDATLDYTVALVTYIGPSFTGLHARSLETEGGYQISLICSVQLFRTTGNSYLQLTPSIYIYSDDNPRPIAVVLSNTTASINISAPMDVLPSYVCNINFTISGGSLSSKCATNQLQNISLTIPSRQVFYSSQIKDNSSLMIVGVVLGIVVLLLLVVAIIEFVIIWRKKHSTTGATTDPNNYDYIRTVRTDADPAEPRVYYSTSRESLNVDQEGAVATPGDNVVDHMYDGITDQTYDSGIHAEDMSQTYDSGIHAEDMSQTYDTEIHAEDMRQTYDSGIHAEDMRQTYDTEIHAEDMRQTYDTEIHAEDMSQTYDTEIHAEDMRQTYDTEIHAEDMRQTYDTEINYTEDRRQPNLALHE